VTHAPAVTPLVNRRFLVLDSLGEGGMGRVVRAFDRDEERIVALKMSREARPAGPDHPLTGEYLHGSRLSHPNIVRVLDMGRVEDGPVPAGTAYLVMESFDGLPVHRRLRPGRAATRSLADFACQVLRALEHVHAHGLVHRDLKPGNILVNRPGDGPSRVKVTDFGLATEYGTSEEPGQVTGSLPYVAPESFTGGSVDGRSDLYGLGILLYFLTVGSLPCPTGDPAAILRWHLDGPDADPARARRSVPDRWSRFVRRMTARAPADRPATATEALAILGAASSRTSAVRPVRGRARIASLRLAVDAARLGGRRLLTLPGSRPARRSILDEARTLARIHGLAYHHVTADARWGGSSLGRVVLDLLMAGGGAVGETVERLGLRLGLPLKLLGGLPLQDRSRHGGRRAGGIDDDATARTSEGVASLIRVTCDRAPVVIAVDRDALRDPLTRETTCRLLDIVRSPSPPLGGRHGLVLLLPADATPVGAG